MAMSYVATVAVAVVRNAEGKAMEHPYSGSYSKPVRDRLGLLSFGWKAIVDGAGSQPKPRTMIVRAPDAEVAPEFITRRIETAIVEHLEGRNLDHVALP